MIILDTDHLSILDNQDSIEAFSIGLRLARASGELVATTAISYEEQMRGWMAYIATAKGPAQEVDAYAKLRQHIEAFRSTPVIDFDAKSAAIFQQLVKQRIRIGTMDLKIAAIALANKALLISRNTTHFTRVPGLRVEDWTV